ncbi:MAG TPA: UDP binding domain-containing protein, partial [Ktedonobacterales bacterium]|nr:UDP binding domain-containing protein [Ktedonobacterales bacterium]
DIIRWLLAQGAEVRAYDPVAIETAQQALASLPVTYGKTSYEVAEGADALVVVTEWNEFKSLNMLRIRNSMRRPILVDGRNIYEPAEMQRMGFTYRGMGRASGNALLGLGNGHTASGALAESHVSGGLPKSASAS